MRFRKLNILKRLLSVVLAVTFSAQMAFAQNTLRKESGSFGARRQLATIIFAGLSGAILGLSTLSFYGRPQDRLSNIAVGFALGIFAGTVYTTYKAASKPNEFYGPGGAGGAYFESPHNAMPANSLALQPIQFSYSF